MSQVLFCCLRISRQAVLLFKDSKSGTAGGGRTRFSNHFKKHARVKGQTQYAYGASVFAGQQKFGPAISEAAESSRCHGFASGERGNEVKCLEHKADVFPTKRVLSSGAETCGGPHGLEELGALMTSEKTKRFLAAI